MIALCSVKKYLEFPEALIISARQEHNDVQCDLKEYFSDTNV